MFMESVFHGRLVKDVELKKTNSGVPYCRFQMACSRYAGKDKGTVTEYPTFVAWDTLADRLVKHTQKGSELLIKSEYTSYKKEIKGEQYPVTMVEFKVLSFDFCGSKKDDAASAQPSAAPASNSAPVQSGYTAPAYDDFDELDGDNDDLPF